MKETWEPKDPNMRAVAAWFSKSGHQVRPPKNYDLTDVLWANSTMVVVQVNPLRFPAPINRYRRRLLFEESLRYGTYKHAVVVKVKSIEGEEPVVVKVKNLPNHIGHPSHVHRSAKDLPDRSE